MHGNFLQKETKIAKRRIEEFCHAPASESQVRTRFYRHGQWTAETSVADNLKGVFGWNAAVLNQATAALAFVLDQDGDFATDQDTEIFLAAMENGSWLAPRQLTSDAHSDWAPQLVYMADGQLTLAWHQSRRPQFAAQAPSG